MKSPPSHQDLFIRTINSINSRFDTKPYVTEVYLREDKFLSESLYNHLNGRRLCTLLTSLVLLNKRHSEERLSKLIINLFNKIYSDVKYTKNEILWLEPLLEEESLLNGNLGIYTGLLLIDRYLIHDKNLATFIRCINISRELNQIKSKKLRKIIWDIVNDGKCDLLDEKVMLFLEDYPVTKNTKVLEFAIFIIVYCNFKITLNTFLKLESLISNFKSSDFINCLLKYFLTISHNDVSNKKINLDISSSAISIITANNFKSIYQFCGDNFLEKVIKSNSFDELINPSLFLSVVSFIFKKKSLLFRHLISGSRLKLHIPKYIFDKKFDDESITISIEILQKCYNSSYDDFFKIKFCLKKNNLSIYFKTLYLDTLNLNPDFANVTDKYIQGFAKNYRYNKFIVLTAKRFEKNVAWLGRSFQDNNEVDFIFFLLNDFGTLNDYKKKYNKNSLEDFRLIEIIFFFLELGLIRVC